MTEPERRDVCGEVHGPDNPVRPEDYKRHRLLAADEATMPAFTSCGCAHPVSVDLLDDWDVLEHVADHPDCQMLVEQAATIRWNDSELAADFDKAVSARD